LKKKNEEKKNNGLFQCKMCLLSKTFTIFAKSKEWREKKKKKGSYKKPEKLNITSNFCWGK